MSLVFNGCLHEDANFLIIYKQKPNIEKISKKTELVCKSCLEDPNLVNASDILHVYNFNTGELIR